MGVSFERGVPEGSLWGGDEVAARLLAGLRPWACRGVARDQLIRLTEGVLVHEEREAPVTLD